MVLRHIPLRRCSRSESNGVPKRKARYSMHIIGWTRSPTRSTKRNISRNQSSLAVMPSSVAQHSAVRYVPTMRTRKPLAPVQDETSTSKGLDSRDVSARATTDPRHERRIDLSHHDVNCLAREQPLQSRNKLLCTAG